MSSRGRFKNKRGGAAAAGKSSRVKRSTGADVGEEREGMWAEPRQAQPLVQSTDDEDHSVSSGSDSGSNDDDDDDIQLPHGKSSAAKTNPESAILQVENPNRVAKTVIKASEMGSSSGAGDAPALSRREREAMEAERKKQAYWKAHLEGKTEQAQSDMARLAIIRKQREEAAKKRAEEEAAKKASSSKNQSLEAGKATISKRLGGK